MSRGEEDVCGIAIVFVAFVGAFLVHAPYPFYRDKPTSTPPPPPSLHCDFDFGNCAHAFPLFFGVPLLAFRPVERQGPFCLISPMDTPLLRYENTAPSSPDRASHGRHISYIHISSSNKRKKEKEKHKHERRINWTPPLPPSYPILSPHRHALHAGEGRHLHQIRR
jgi:hypothetical protein